MYNLAYITDRNYVLPTKVSIRSAIESACNKEITIWIIGVEITDSDKKSLEALGTENAIVKVLEVYGGFENCSGQAFHISKAALYKFRLANIFESLDRLLYIDSDTILMPGYLSIFDIDINDNYLGAVRDIGCEIKRGRMHLFSNMYYFNSGIMIMNLKKMREDDCIEKMIDWRTHNFDMYMDQDTINAVCGGNVYDLPPKYNFLLYMIGQFSEEDMIDFWKEFDADCVRGMIEKPLIYHMAGGLKPWDDTWSEKADIWMSYLTDQEMAECAKKYFFTAAQREKNKFSELEKRISRNEEIIKKILGSIEAQKSFLSVDSAADNAVFFYPLGKELRFSEDLDMERYIVSGMYEAELWGRWSKGKEIILQFLLDDKVRSDLTLHMEYAVLDSNQRVSIYANDQRIAAYEENEEYAIHDVQIPGDLLIKGMLRLRFVLPDAFRPYEKNGGVGDERMLAIGISKMSIDILH